MKRIILTIITILIFLAASLSVSAADCPKDNVIKKMTSGMQAVKDAQPLKFSTVKSAGAEVSKNGKKLKVSLSNGDFTAAQMANSFVVPLKNKGEFILTLNFSNGADPVKAGKYDPAAGYGKPFWVTAEIKVLKGPKGTIAMLSVAEGSAEIIQMTDKTICGTFHLKTKAGAKTASEVAGTFNCELTKSRW